MVGVWSGKRRCIPTLEEASVRLQTVLEFSDSCTLGRFCTCLGLWICRRKACRRGLLMDREAFWKKLKRRVELPSGSVER